MDEPLPDPNLLLGIQPIAFQPKSLISARHLFTPRSTGKSLSISYQRPLKSFAVGCSICMRHGAGVMSMCTTKCPLWDTATPRVVQPHRRNSRCQYQHALNLHDNVNRYAERLNAGCSESPARLFFL